MPWYNVQALIELFVHDDSSEKACEQVRHIINDSKNFSDEWRKVHETKVVYERSDDSDDAR